MNIKIDYKLSLLGLSNAIIAKFGVVPKHEPLPIEMLGPKFKDAKRVVLILIDAMGYDVASKLCDDVDFRYIKKPQKISTVFPSTTVNVLTTLATASSPIEHGMLGYILYLKEFGTLANMIEFTPIGMERDFLIPRGADPLKFVDAKTIYQSLKNYGANPLVIIPNAFKESGLSKIHSQGSTVQGFFGIVDMMVKLRKNIESKDFSYIYAYWPMVDTMGHTYGPNSEEYYEESKNVLKMFEELVYDRLSPALRDETVFILTADHGQIQTSWQHEYKISFEDEFTSTLEIMPTGEPRVMYLYTKDCERTIEEGKKIFGNDVNFYKSIELASSGAFGPGQLNPKSLLRIGDLVAIPEGDHSFVVKYTGNEHRMKGKHGGISNEEMHVPLFVI
jgi:predicted AlkP superfamily pyrophosphatase or phosphodiesterase